MFAVFIWIFFSFIVCIVAYSKGRSWAGWFFLSILISPLISLIVLLCVGDSEEKKEEALKKAVNVINKSKIQDEETNDIMTQEKAIKELQKAKKLLELEIISQEEYNAKKAELAPILRNEQSIVKEEEEPEPEDMDSIEPENIEEIETNQIEPKIEKWYQRTWVQILTTSFFAALLIAGIIIIGQHTSKQPKDQKKPATISVNYQDNSLEHQIYAKDKFIENLATIDEYLIKKGTLKDYVSTFNSKNLRYNVTVCYDVMRMNEMRTEIYKGDVYVSTDGRLTRCDLPYRANFKYDNNDGVIGRWIISIPSVKQAYESIIKKEGSSYYVYEFGKKRRLSKKGDCYYELNNKAGEYYKIVGRNLRLCDKQGDFTNLSGYSISTVYVAQSTTVKPSTTSTKTLAKQPAVSTAKVKSELQSLYKDLLGFKNKSDFALWGFDIDGPYNYWLKKAETFDNKTYAEVLAEHGIAPGDVKMLGIEYVKTKGQEDDYTRYLRSEIDAAINKMK